MEPATSKDETEAGGNLQPEVAEGEAQEVPKPKGQGNLTPKAKPLAKAKPDKAKANRKAKKKMISCQTCEHNIYTHFPRDPDCEVCQRVKVH